MHRPWPDPQPNQNVMIVCYCKPLDFPEYAVLRAQYVSAGKIEAHGLAMLFPTVDDAVRFMRRNYPDKVFMDRHPNDEMQIVGAWI